MIQLRNYISWFRFQMNALRIKKIKYHLREATSMNKGFKKVITTVIVLGALCISATPVFAAIPAGTVILGNQAFSLTYANDTAHISVIQKALIASKAVWVKGFNSVIVDNSTSKPVDASIIPAVTYTDAQGATSQYAQGDGDLISDFTVISIE